MRMENLRSLGHLFYIYVERTKPQMAYFLIRRRSYRKKRKIFVNKFILKIAKRSNQGGKLVFLIKSIFFRGKNRSKKGKLGRNLRRFIIKEVLLPYRSMLYKKKSSIYEKVGADSMNNLLLRNRTKNR